MQKRLIRKLDLEIFLEQIQPHPHPKANLEQYTVSAGVAATMLYIATYINNDIINKLVLDLGCGTGRLALGAAFLGAKEVVGVDIDRNAVRLALENTRKTDFKQKAQWINTDVDVVCGYFDTVLQNPPFGVQKWAADQKFLRKALEIGGTIYSLHKSSQMNKAFIKKLKTSKDKVAQSSPSPFLEKFIEKHGGEIRAVYSIVMAIPHLFDFHRKKKYEFVVDLYVIRGSLETTGFDV